jgi:hypothetical protein
MAKKMYESPQVAKDGLATPTRGGAMPSKEDIVKSANARAQKRHAVKSPSDNEADSLVPKSGGQVLDRAGVDNNNYIVKKGLEFGVEAQYNSLPPGMDIEDQENADIRKMEQKNYSGGLGYPGDGWT